MKNIVLNKYYRNLRKNVFDKLEMQEFLEVYTKFKRLNIQYKLLKIAIFLENIKIPTFDVPIIRFFYKVNGLYTLGNIRFTYVSYQWSSIQFVWCNNILWTPTVVVKQLVLLNS